MSSRTVVSLVALLALAVPACTGDGASREESTTDRVAAVQAAREGLAAPAQQLGTAAVEVEARAQELQDAPGREQDVSDLEASLDELAEASADLEEVELDAATSDVREATEVVDELVDGADRLSEAGRDLVEVGRELVEVNARLEELRRTWDEPGSRSEVLDRLDETATAAEGLVVDAPAACPGPVEERNAAAEFVAEASRDLETHVSSYDGPGYDERRAELADAPYGRTSDDEARRLDVPIDAEACPALERATTAAGDVEQGLDALEDALNPSDLAS